MYKKNVEFFLTPSLVFDAKNVFGLGRKSGGRLECGLWQLSPSTYICNILFHKKFRSLCTPKICE